VSARLRVAATFAGGVLALALASLGTGALGASTHHRRAHARACVHARHHRHGARRCRSKTHKGSRNLPTGATGATGAGGGAGAPPLPVEQVVTPSGEPPGSGAPPPPTVPHVLVTAVEWSFSLSRASVPAGKVVLQFVDHGQDEHNLNVSSEGSLSGSLPDTHPDEMRQLTLNLRPGSYKLFCSLPEHEARGMKATLVVS
jgi:plastocyanin